MTRIIEVVRPNPPIIEISVTESPSVIEVIKRGPAGNRGIDGPPGPKGDDGTSWTLTDW